MSLPHILLGLLSEPASGYDLKQVFDRTLRHFWAAELSQIYPALNRLERDGLLESESATSSRGPARRVYRRTEAGTRALLEWLSGPPETPQPRLGFLAQTFFMAELGSPGATQAFLTRLGEDLQASLGVYRALESAWFSEPRELDDAGLHAYLTLRFGILRTEAALAWCDEALGLLEEHE